MFLRIFSFRLRCRVTHPLLHSSPDPHHYHHHHHHHHQEVEQLGSIHYPSKVRDILSASGETGWFNYRDTEKTGFIVRASDRIESLPFKLDATESSSFPDNVPNRYFSRPRFNEGFYSFFDDDGGLTSPSTDSDHTQEPIPADLRSNAYVPNTQRQYSTHI